MSAGLMSCVRENSPPLEAAENESGALSLPPENGSISPNNSPLAEQQKRRRFHPLRNLRRMFRRRTLTSVELSSTSTCGDTNQLSVSSPSSPLQHQQLQQQNIAPPTIAGNTLSVPAHSYAGTTAFSTSLPTSPLLLLSVPASALANDSQDLARNVTTTSNIDSMQQYNQEGVISAMSSSSTSIHYQHVQQQHQQEQQYLITSSANSSTGRNLVGRVGVLPGAFNSRTSMSGGYYVINDNGSSMPESGVMLVRDVKLKSTGTESINDLDTNREMTDSQRSLSEGRLMDSDFSRDALSQSHDSVFSESATASSLSIVLKAELADVLRKRRNRPETSDEDLGLPRSPTTPQRREPNNATIQSEVSSLSLLSMSSTTDFDDDLPSSTANPSNEFALDHTSSSVSSKYSAESSRSEDVELFSSNWTRLSHSAAKHKMAVRPIKKKGPSRHRRTIESSVLPSTPEVNEDLSKIIGNSLDVKEIPVDKVKSRSLPPGVNAKILEQNYSTELKQATAIKRSKTEKLKVVHSLQTTISKTSTTSSEDFDSQKLISTSNDEDRGGFLRRLVIRSSKRDHSKSPNRTTELDGQMKNHLLEENVDITTDSSSSKLVEYSQKVEETRKEIRREILSEGKSALSVMLNTFFISSDSDKSVASTRNDKSIKPKSGPAARQRCIPKDLTQSEEELSAVKKARTSTEHEVAEQVKPKVPAKNRKPHVEESYNTISLIRDISGERESSTDPTPMESREHFEKKPKIVGLSAFQQKITKSNESYCTSSSTDSIDVLYSNEAYKRGKSVEKSKSFRVYPQEKEKETLLKNQMPSLPDLTQKNEFDLDDSMHRDLSLGFEINDNNLVNQKPNDSPVTHGIYTKNIILTTSKITPPIGQKSPLSTSPCNKDISEIEENIDKLVKLPFVSVLRKSATISDSVASKVMPVVTISPMITIKNEPIIKVESKIDKILGVDDKELCTTKSSPPSSLYTVMRSSSSTSTATNSPTVQMRDKPKTALDADRKSYCERTTTQQTKSNSYNRPRRSSSVIEATDNDTDVPEFMKIQLNRVEPIRSKTNVVLSKNARESSEDLRRFSNESVEISEVIPPACPEEPSHSEVQPSNMTTPQSQCDELPPKTPEKTTNAIDETAIRPIETSTPINNNIPLHERRKVFLNDDKVKMERKPEDAKLDRKKSISEEGRKCPGDDEPVVVILRKKSFGISQTSVNNNRDDPTPELMKVFARRSLKIKDDDLSDSPIKKFIPSMDSDKENQSSSEEKLDRLANLQQQQNGGPKIDSDNTKNRNSLADFRNYKPNSLNNNSINTSAKPLLSSIRLSGPFRTAGQQSSLIGSPSHTNNNNNNLITNNNNLTKSTERQSLGSVVLSSSVPPNSSSTSPNRIITMERSLTMASMSRSESEFKGIHQRRAEWEKRAKEALK